MLNIAEIFSSLQGEGPYIGTKQIFLRLSGCNLSCSYCDTSWAQQSQQKFTVDIADFHKEYLNPLSAKVFTEELIPKLGSDIFAISITGGEPLLQASNLAKVLPPLQAKVKILLETNGTMAKELELVLPWVDIISMDIKFPQYCAENYFSKHAQFLNLATTKDVYIKMVIGEDTITSDIIKSAELIAKIAPKTPTILQPLFLGELHPLWLEKLIKVQSELLKVLPDVRIIPQMHKLLGIR